MVNVNELPNRKLKTKPYECLIALEMHYHLDLFFESNEINCNHFQMQRINSTTVKSASRYIKYNEMVMFERRFNKCAYQTKRNSNEKDEWHVCDTCMKSARPGPNGWHFISFSLFIHISKMLIINNAKLMRNELKNHKNQIVK